MDRRAFMGTSAIGAVLGAGLQAQQAAQRKPEELVQFLSDGLIVSPLAYAQLLAQLAERKQIKPDVYLNDGPVAELETRFAKLLGKEQALFVPTGTLANHLAIRTLAGQKSRVLVQAESHVYRDSLDCVPTLSHLNLVPVGQDQATVPASEFAEAFRRAQDKPFPLGVGVISLECPVRRKTGAVFELEEMQRIAAFAKERDIKMHLDGARLWIAAAYAGVAPADYAALFDTVYVSLYKSFNAGTGAILAGPRAIIEQVAQARKLFGGNLYQAWTYAAVALHYLEGFAERYAKAVALFKALFSRLQEYAQFRVELIPNGTNIVRLHLKDIDAERFRRSLLGLGIVLPRPSTDITAFELRINESLNRRTADDLADAFIGSISK